MLFRSSATFLCRNWKFFQVPKCTVFMGDGPAVVTGKQAFEVKYFFCCRIEENWDGNGSRIEAARERKSFFFFF